jgi:hypothetical protein
MSTNHHALIVRAGQPIGLAVGPAGGKVYQLEAVHQQERYVELVLSNPQDSADRVVLRFQPTRAGHSGQGAARSARIYA